jgi:hypothetical protein
MSILHCNIGIDQQDRASEAGWVMMAVAKHEDRVPVLGRVAALA